MTEPAPAPRPVLVSAAAIVLIVLGGGLVASSLVDLSALAGSLAAEVRDAVDGMTALVTMIIAVIAAGLILAGGAIGLLEIVVAARLWQRVRWAWIEASAVSVVGLVVAWIVMSDPPAASEPMGSLHGAWTVAAIAGHAFVMVAVLLSRKWFGRLSWPTTDADAPFWLRRGRFR